MLQHRKHPSHKKARVIAGLFYFHIIMILKIVNPRVQDQVLSRAAGSLLRSKSEGGPLLRDPRIKQCRAFDRVRFNDKGRTDKAFKPVQQDVAFSEYHSGDDAATGKSEISTPSSFATRPQSCRILELSTQLPT
jgi:hypothetical protein